MDEYRIRNTNLYVSIPRTHLGMAYVYTCILYDPTRDACGSFSPSLDFSTPGGPILGRAMGRDSEEGPQYIIWKSEDGKQLRNGDKSNKDRTQRPQGMEGPPKESAYGTKKGTPSHPRGVHPRLVPFPPVLRAHAAAAADEMFVVPSRYGIGDAV